MSNQHIIAIIGGGAAGMVAAIAAKTHVPGTKVLLLERNDRLGKKLLATGNGRCNFTNINAAVNYYHGRQPAFTTPVFAQFGVKDTIAFFERLGIVAKVEDFGKVYPYSGQASSLLDVLRLEIDRLNIEVVYRFAAIAIRPTQAGFNITGPETLFADKVIVTTGGCAAPASGSDGSGFKLLASLGHILITPTPALVQIKTDTAITKSLQGIKISGTATAVSQGTPLRCESGDILFTEYGLSGPPLLQLSRTVTEHPAVSIVIDLMPEYQPEEVKGLITARINANPTRTVEHLFTGMLNKRIGQAVAKCAGIEKLSTPVTMLTATTIKQMAGIIKGWEFKTKGTTGFNNAQVSAGGISVEQFSQMLQSKRVPNLYAAGEVLDIDGDCGGFNLQWAWSSGYVAGRQAACAVKSK